MIYGALGNPYFKFYDIRNAESTTRSGREILMHMAKAAAEIMDGEYKYPSPSIIYGDTDSNMIKLGTETLEDSIKVADYLVKQINNSFSQFVSTNFKCNTKHDKFIRADYEYIFDRGIFVDKKLYALHLIYENGEPTDSMKIMGLALKKTTLPKHVSKKLTFFLEKLLKGADWNDLGKEMLAYKDELLNTEDILQIGLPKGIKGLEKYHDEYLLNPTTRLPGHVAAAILWNKCIKEYNDTSSEKITSGMKLKVLYLKKKIERFRAIAVPTDITELPTWFKEHYLHIICRDTQVEKLVDQTMENILVAIEKTMPTKKSLLVDELVEY